MVAAPGPQSPTSGTARSTKAIAVTPRTRAAAESVAQLTASIFAASSSAAASASASAEVQPAKTSHHAANIMPLPLHGNSPTNMPTVAPAASAVPAALPVPVPVPVPAAKTELQFQAVQHLEAILAHPSPGRQVCIELRACFTAELFFGGRWSL